LKSDIPIVALSQKQNIPGALNVVPSHSRTPAAESVVIDKASNLRANNKIIEIDALHE
jgi:hypothetical protein